MWTVPPLRYNWSTFTQCLSSFLFNVSLCALNLYLPDIILELSPTQFHPLENCRFPTQLSLSFFHFKQISAAPSGPLCPSIDVSKCKMLPPGFEDLSFRSVCSQLQAYKRHNLLFHPSVQLCIHTACALCLLLYSLLRICDPNENEFEVIISFWAIACTASIVCHELQTHSLLLFITT